jgi:hypothetical protein
MTDESKDFIEELQAEAKLRFGRELTPSEAAAKFSQHTLDHRIEHLKNLRSDETSNVRKAAERLTFERALKDVHHSLRKVGR